MHLRTPLNNNDVAHEFPKLGRSDRNLCFGD